MFERLYYNIRNKFLKPFNCGYLPPKDGHEIYFQEVGNPNGKPVICFHGGPGGSSKVGHAFAFDLKKYRVILFDQRGCGNSKAQSAFAHNGIQEIVSDAKRLLDFLDIKGKVMSCGCSWGSTCAVLFAQTYPELVNHIVLSAVFLARKEDFDNMSPIAPYFYPDLLDDLNNISNQTELDSYFAALLFSAKKSDRQKAMRYYKTLEHTVGRGALSYKFEQKEFEDKEIAKFQIFMHYKINNSFLEENQLIRDCYKIAHIPTHIYQNRWDPCCPPSQAYLLHKSLPKSKLFLRADRGHVSNGLFWQMYLDNLKDYK